MSQADTKVARFAGNDAGRALPHSEEAERCLLGCLFLNPQAIGDCIEKFASKDAEHRGAEHFYKHAHRLIYRTLIDMNDAREPVDLLTVTQKLAGRSQLEESGGAVYLTQLLNAVPTAANLEYFLNIVRSRFRLRQLIQAGTQIVSDSYETTDEQVDDMIDQAEKLVFNIAQEKNSQSIVNTHMSAANGIVSEAVKEFEELIKSKGEMTGLSSGFRDLDSKTNGLQPGAMIVIAARPSMGKTSLAMNIVEYVSILNYADPQPVGVFSLEMPAIQLVMRMICSVAEISMGKIRGGISSPSDNTAIIAAASKISKAKILIDETGDLTIMELRAKARRMKNEHDIQLLVVDYLQLMRAPTKGNFDNRQQEISAISGGLKALAKELKVPVIVLSQLNREAEKREGGKPKLSDLRESGAIEQDADVVCLIAPQNEKREDGDVHAEEIRPVTLIVAKNRNGPQAAIPLQFRSDITRFFPTAMDAADIPIQQKEY